MMSPYEGERIFEAEMVRLHQCDRNFYACTQSTAPEPGTQRSLRQWLADLTGVKPTKPQMEPESAAESNI